MNSEQRLFNVLLAPHVSEKSTLVGSLGQYVFKVRSDANKIEIKQAIEKLFKVKVESVRIANMKSKQVRFGRTQGQRQAWKKAYVALREGQSIDFGAKG